MFSLSLASVGAFPLNYPVALACSSGFLFSLHRPERHHVPFYVLQLSCILKPKGIYGVKQCVLGSFKRRTPLAA